MGNPRLTDYFKAVERRFGRLEPEEGSCIQIQVLDKVFALHFLKKEHAETVARYLIVPVLDEPRTPDASFYYWTEDCTVYKPAHAADETAVWTSRDDTGYLRVCADREMIGTDFSRNAYYHCRQPQDYTDFMIHGHSLVTLFGRWAIRNSCILLHSASVGVGGKGVIISARAGGGKSTLAISCLLGGFDFVSDDYVLVNQEGPMKAMPLYRVIGINQDMAAILKPDMPVLRTEPRRENKLYLDVSGYPIKSEIPVNAIIYPHPCAIGEPEIVPASPGSVLPGIIDSTARNMQTFRDPEPYRIMSKRLLGLPVYEFRLTQDLFKNREKLKEFITKELS